MTLSIANGAGFLGDNLNAPRLLVEAAEVDYLTLEYLAELTMSILAAIRAKNANGGFAGDFLEVLSTLSPAILQQPQLKIITNAGGVNPNSCAKAAASILIAAGLADERIGVVTGDDILTRLDELQSAGCRFESLETGEPLADVSEQIVTANAYLGAKPICDALMSDARFVITGRVADASLTVGPAMTEFDWQWDDWTKLAAATVAGHLIECGAQVTGGYSTQWNQYDLSDVGYPIAELSEEGGCVITKPASSGGAITRQTVVEQLVYEIGDPAHYLTPDVDVDFTTVEVQASNDDRVNVFGAIGGPAPDSYKVSLAYRSGFTAIGQLLVYGNDCIEKARECGTIVFERLKRAGVELATTNTELLGAGDRFSDNKANTNEVVLRLTVQDPRREAVERFTKEIAPLITSGPAGLAGYAAGRNRVIPAFTYWPCLVPKELIEANVEVRTAREWATFHDK